MKRIRLETAVAKYILRTSRGTSLTNVILDPVRDGLQWSVYAFAITELFDIHPTKQLLIFGLGSLIVCKKAFEYVLGWVDERHWGFWKKQNDYASRVLNPYYSELIEKVTDIQTKVNEER